jgi:transposase
MKGSTCSMTSSSDSAPMVYVGVDTHTDTHHIAVVSEHGKKLADREFPTTAAGYTAVERWITSFGQVARIGIEGSGSYGVELARYLHTRGYNVAEVPRPNRRLRRTHGKTDTIDAYAAARRLLDGSGVTAPKLRNSAVESVRAVRVARHGAVKATTAALNALRGLITTCPEELRSQLRGLPRAKLVATCAAFRPVLDEALDSPQARRRIADSAAAEAALFSGGLQIRHLRSNLTSATVRLLTGGGIRGKCRCSGAAGCRWTTEAAVCERSQSTTGRMPAVAAQAESSVEL